MLPDRSWDRENHDHPSSSLEATNGTTRHRTAVSVVFFNETASLGRKFKVAGRPQHIMVILRNQSKNKENLPRTHDSKFWSQPFSLEGVHIRPKGPQEQHGRPQRLDKTEESGVRYVFSMKLLLWEKNSRKSRNVCRIKVSRKYDCRKASGHHGGSQKPVQLHQRRPQILI